VSEQYGCVEPVYVLVLFLNRVVASFLFLEKYKKI